MLFNSIEFLVFFLVVTSLYYLLPFRFRWVLLLTASCIFYMFFIPIYILILGFTIVIDYFAGIMIFKERIFARKRKFLLLSLFANIGVLFFFKYFNFFAENVTLLGKTLGLTYDVQFMNIILPIGLSFHTFQAMSYIIEVYRGNQIPERHFGIYALYVMFYPQLVAGPIERPQNILHQLKENHHFNLDNIYDGLKRMGWGFFKKIVVADRLAVFVNPVFTHPSSYSPSLIFAATLFFTFQIYCDFSGYSDIAIGSARVLGIDLMRNFNYPYISQNISEFWRRWHISLSTWFRDYVYIPLGGNRVSRAKSYRNIMVVFLLSGLWHGASWTYVLWGMLHGAFFILHSLSASLRQYFQNFFRRLHLHQIAKVFNIMLTFSVVLVAWIFFRANSVGDAFYMIGRLGTGLGEIANNVRSAHDIGGLMPLLRHGFYPIQFYTACFLILLLLLLEYSHRQLNLYGLLLRMPTPLRWATYYTAILFVIGMALTGSEQQFIYFQF